MRAAASALCFAFGLAVSAPGPLRAAPPNPAATVAVPPIEDAARRATTMAAASAAALHPGIALLLALTEQSEDDPKAVVGEVDGRLGGSSAEQRFWLLLAKARALALLEEPDAQTDAVAAAATALAAMPGDRARERLWLSGEQLAAAIGKQTPAQLGARALSLRREVERSGEALLACELLSIEFWLLNDAGSLDEAWIAAEALERCARETGLAYQVPLAFAGMGQVASVSQLVPGRSGQPVEYFRRSLAALEGRPSRFRRSLVEWDLGNMLRRSGDHDAARSHLQQAMQASRELGDRAGIAAAQIAIARIKLDTGDHRAMLPLLDEALEALRGHDTGARMAGAMELKILALARLGQARVLTEIDAARTLDRAELQPAMRASLVRAIAEGYASQQAWSRAYAEMQRAHALEKDGKSAARDDQVLRLQSRYDNVRRDAENAELRHRSEIAQLALERSSAQRQRLLAAALALGLLATAGIALAARLWQRRRAFAALALRDELTGAANRRAVSAYAQAQFEQAERLRVPMTLALIDLDRFKQVNDEHGHAAGDELLKAFVAAAQPALRGQDRLGRWGGEEWLLVLPGTRAEELPRLFARLRESFAHVLVPGLPTPHGATFSMGGAALGEHTPSLSALILEADGRLYRAKQEGRDRLVWAD